MRVIIVRMWEHNNSMHLVQTITTRLLTVVAFLLGGCNDYGIDPPTAVQLLAIDRSPAWAPGGNWICYEHVNMVRDDSSYPTGLYLVDSSGGNRHLLLRGPAHHPDWNPNGRTIAFASGDIYAIDSTGDSLHAITSFGSAFFPEWSHDGKRLAFDHSGSPDSVGMWVLTVSDERLIHLTYGSDPSWSPDGTQIVFSGPRGPTSSESQIWIIDTAGIRKSELTFNDSHTNRNPTWSPSGRMIAWTTDSGISLMAADGSNQRHFLSLYASGPSWSPDSKQLAFARLAPSKDRSVIWKVGIDGNGEMQITH